MRLLRVQGNGGDGVITAQYLAQLLAEELARDEWGDVDPFLIECVAASTDGDPEDAHSDDTKAMRAVLERVADRLNTYGIQPS